MGDAEGTLELDSGAEVVSRGTKRSAMDELALFINGIHRIPGHLGTPILLSFWRGLSPGLRYVPVSSGLLLKSGSSVNFMPNALFYFCSV